MNRLLGVLVAIGLCSGSGAAFAQQQVFHPVNPNFGGNPLNGTFLMQQAQGQGLGLQQQQQQFPNINFPDLGNLGANTGTGSVIIVQPGATPTSP
jgi:curli production assembly/transport component CsgF